jgi:hypothetical protein
VVDAIVEKDIVGVPEIIPVVESNVSPLGKLPLPIILYVKVELLLAVSRTISSIDAGSPAKRLAKDPVGVIQIKFDIL